MAWTSPRTWVSNEVVSAATMNTHVRDNLNALAPTIVIKGSDETVNTNAVLQNDDDLVFAVGANEHWEFEINLLVNSNSTADFKFTLVSPASSIGVATIGSQGATPSVAYGSTIASFGTNSLQTSGDTYLRIQGWIKTDATPGTVQLQWAQNTSNGSDTTVKAGSWLRAQMIFVH